MKLLLTSAGLSNESIVKALQELVKKPFTKLNLAFIPTAANVEDGDKSWLIEDLINCKKLEFKSIDIVDISAISKDMWLSRLEKADVLYFEGGNTFHLMHWLKKTGLKDILPEMLKTKVYVGVSAGSMVACENLGLSTSDQLYLEDKDDDVIAEGLGFVNFLIRPHLNSPYFTNVNITNLEKIATEIKDAFYAIDDNTAIKVVDDKVTVISEGAWKKFN